MMQEDSVYEMPGDDELNGQCPSFKALCKKNCIELKYPFFFGSTK